MEDDPFQGFPDALLRLVRAAQRRTGHDQSEVAWEIAESAVVSFEPYLDALEERAWTLRREIENDLARDLASPLRALDSMIGVAGAVSVLLRSDELIQYGPPATVRYATVMLLSRAISIANEILALTRAGFAVGARARWRTLYELDVVAAVLLRGNRGTAARYVNHRWVIVAERHEEFFADDESWADAAPEVTRMANKFIKRYGPVYKSTYGWAAELTNRRLGVERPQWWHLVRLANLEGHERHVAYANRAIHADAIGGLLTVESSSGLFHSGASYDGVEGACLATVRVLGEILDSLIRIWGRYQGSDLTMPLALVDELSLILQRHCLTGHGVRRSVDVPHPE